VLGLEGSARAVAIPSAITSASLSHPPSGPPLATAASPSPAPRPAPTAANSAPGSFYDPGRTARGLPPITNSRPLPTCTYGGVATPLTGFGDWRITLVDTTFALPDSYAPPDLVNPIAAGIYSGYHVRSLAIPDLRAMASEAAAAGAPLGIVSGYRSYWTQVSTFDYWVAAKGYDRALLESARAGHSEHQLGLALDFRDIGGRAPWDYRDFALESKAGIWLAANAWRYGFVMSYPDRRSARTCYTYEPWHYRYVGPVVAADVRASGLTLREWLWQRQPDVSASNVPAAVRP
jgi:D-alanyl-D-alanine carboxypeptidase